jgi:hypothetical protein
MAKRPLKVFRTSTGFQDAYVAVPSRKGALEAWGARTDLFASGIAELVTDPKLTEAPLAAPGKVIRMARGTTAQHLAAAGKGRKSPAAKTKRDDSTDAAQLDAAPPPPPRKRLPRPSRSKLEKAEAVLDASRLTFADAMASIDEKMARLRREREQLRVERDGELAKLQDHRDREDEAYRAALERWEG